MSGRCEKTGLLFKTKAFRRLRPCRTHEGHDGGGRDHGLCGLLQAGQLLEQLSPWTVGRHEPLHALAGEDLTRVDVAL